MSICLTEWEAKLLLKSLQDRASKLDKERSLSGESEDAAVLAENDLMARNSFRSRFEGKVFESSGTSVLNLSEELL